MSPKKVAVIGAGVSGLTTLRQLASDPENFIPVAYDKGKHVGGLWVYSDETGHDASGERVHSALYKDLRTNVAKEIVGFPDVPFPEDLPSFIHHTDVLKYLEQFADNFNLHQYIKFETYVKNVEPESVGGAIIWHVTTVDLGTKVESTSQFDAVFVCNGHEHCPHIPTIPGQESFKGEIIHSKYFRTVEPYTDKTVLIYGMNFSGNDLLYHLAPVAKKILAVHKTPFGSKLPKNAIDIRGIKQITETGIITSNDEFHEVDVIFYAIGYDYDFPFLSENCHVKVKDNRITPLYKHVLHIEFPGLFFIGLFRRFLVFRILHLQAVYACGVLKGQIPLPSTSDMLKDEADEYNQRIVLRGKEDRLIHDFEGGPDQYDYIDDLGGIAGVKVDSPAIRILWDHHLHLWSSCFDYFRNLNFRLGESE